MAEIGGKPTFEGFLKFIRLAQASVVERGSIIVRSIWAVCLLIGGLNHARTLLQHGLSWDYGGANPISAVY